MTHRSRMLAFSAAAGALGLAAVAWSQVGAPPNAADIPAVAAIREAVSAGADKDHAEKKDKPKRFPDFAEVTKDMKADEGLFTLYRYDPQDKDHDPERLLAKIPKALLNEDLLFATTLNAGGPFTGYQWADSLVRWEIAGNNLKLVTPDTRYATKESNPVNDVIKRTYNETYLAAVPILSMTPGGDVLIDLGPLFKSNLAEIPGVNAVRADLSTWSKVKNFPDNVLISADLACAERSGGGRSVDVGYAFRRLPKLGAYAPRNADARIGYFLTARQDWTKPADDREMFDRFISRWPLKKKDPSLELSPPEQPIVFIIEKTVPIQWRRWVREGILEWNKAFEKIGYTDAIVVQQQTDDNEYKDYDPEDARYNFFRWIVSGRPFAMGPSRVDPRTGQILDADIIMDDSFARAWLTDFDIFAPGTVTATMGEGFAEYVKQYPQLVPPNLFGMPAPQTEDDKLRALIAAKLQEMGRCNCSYAEGMQQEMAFGNCALIATSTGKKLPERFFGEAIKLVVTHEVGHTLGLRHNFKGSSWLSLDEIRERRNTTDEPTTASVMDYNPLLFFGGDELDKLRHFVTPTIGPYDYWAIEYGYANPPQGKQEKDFLKDIAGRCAQPGLQYATDEDTLGSVSPDPTSNRYDLSTDAVTWARSRVDLCDKLLTDVSKWSVRNGEPKYYITNAYNTLWFEKSRNFDYVSRVIGGQYCYRDNVGDPDARPAFVLVDSNTQRDALKYISDTLFNDDFFKVSPDTLNNLAVQRWSHWGLPQTIRVDYPVHDRIAVMQTRALLSVTSPLTLQRIYDAEMKTDDPHRFSAAELLQTTRDVIWSKLDQPEKGPFSDSSPYLSSVQRNLQRRYLDIMVAQVRFLGGTAFSPDLHGMISFCLRELSDKIGAKLEKGGKNIDFASRAHLTDCKSRIDRVLSAQFQAE